MISCNNNNNTAFDPFDPKNFDSISLESESTDNGIILTLRLLPTDIVVDGWINVIERNSGIKFENMDIAGFNENKEITLLFPYTKNGEEYKFSVQCNIAKVDDIGNKREFKKEFSPITAKYTTGRSIDLSYVKNSEITPTISVHDLYCDCDGGKTEEVYELKVEAPGYDNFVSSCGKTAWWDVIFCKGYVDYSGPNHFYWGKNPHSFYNNKMYVFEGQVHNGNEYNDITDLKNDYDSVWGALVIAYWDENGQQFSYQRDTGVIEIDWN